jgi:hypothetical protein
MSTKKVNTQKLKEKVSTILTTAKTSVKKANEYALNTTENVVTESITVASEWQKVLEQALKGGVKLLNNQQNIVFDTLESYKNHLSSGKKRLGKIFS